MSTLYRNDAAGTYPQSWYAATAKLPPPRKTLNGTHKADVCVIGAGYTGLTAARTLATKGLSVIVLEAHRAGFGASGRNGGQIASGYNAPQRVLAAKLGQDTARALWDLTQEAKDDVAANCAAFDVDTRYRPGIAHGCYSGKENAVATRDAAFLQDTYGYDKIEALAPDTFRDIVKSAAYQGGVIDRGGAHMHPLRYALALAATAEAAGAQIFETSPVHHIANGPKATLRCSKGRVQADHVIIATNGYINGLDRKVAARVLPLNSFICATEPLGDAADSVLGQDIAVEDSKHFVNYYRLSEDKRLLFGGRASARIAFPNDIGNLLRTRFAALFPHIKDVSIDYAWGGTLGVTTSGLPAILRVAPNIVAGGGFAGHGVALSGLTGKVMAEAVAGQADRFDTLARLPAPPFPAGPMGGRGLLGLYLTWAGLREKLWL